MLNEAAIGHSQRSPSSADRWMSCLGSVVLCQDLPNTTSAYAEEGSDAHELGAFCLEEQVDATTLVGRPLPSGNVVTEEMAAHVQTGYLEPVRTYAVGGTLLVEVKVPIGAFTGEAGGFGTADAVIIREDRELCVIDFKYGAGVDVSPEWNKQGMLYALGAVTANQLESELDIVRIVICQPRTGNGKPKEWVVSYNDLVAFGEDVKKVGAKLNRGFELIKEVGTHNLPFVVSEKTCKFCKAKATCPEIRKTVETMAMEGFEDLTQPGVGGPERVAEVAKTRAGGLGAMMDTVDLVETWAKAVRAAVEAALLSGQVVTGAEGPYKLVQGRKGARKWVDEKAIIALLKDKFRMSLEDAFDLKVISPTTAEKRLAKEHPKRWAQCVTLVTQSEPSLSVAPASDKRPPHVMMAPTDGFTAIEDCQDLLG